MEKSPQDITSKNGKVGKRAEDIEAKGGNFTREFFYAMC